MCSRRGAVAAAVALVLLGVLARQDPLGLAPQAGALRRGGSPQLLERVVHLQQEEQRAAAAGDLAAAMRFQAQYDAIVSAVWPGQQERRRRMSDWRLDDGAAQHREAAAASSGGAAQQSDAAPDGAESGPATLQAGEKCSGRPYHMLLTAQGSVYQMWQSRMMYYHYMKQKMRDPCKEMGDFTRLVACKKDTIPQWQDEVPSFYVDQLPDEDIAKFKGYGVINRPYSVRQWIGRPDGLAKVKEEYIFIAETDHLFTRPMPNLATPETPVAYKFGYMGPNPRHINFMRRVWPDADVHKVQPGGPSPIIIHRDQLTKLTETWYQTARKLKMDPEADKALGWVIEMWGYCITCAMLGIRHKMLEKFQIEPGSGTKGLKPDFWKDYYIYHFTYGMEYFLDGRPSPAHTIGEWSLDKRHYGAVYPPRNLDPPPEGANQAAKWLLRAWNEASANIPNWPPTKAMGTHGWRREKLRPEDLERSRLARAVAGTTWHWTSHDKVTFRRDGVFVTPWGEGQWGLVNSPGCPIESCLAGDFVGALHNFRFVLSAAGDPVLDEFTSVRIGDEHTVRPRRAKDTEKA
eukprot:TRINITY_DN34110_c0_g1_i1.p1 TRINITY_DN34110_c0_g1~~TRINITY_DN34110_c0_g1_i1.p1  ORF type:complete len:574 (+),score=154.18 TRINITY_DN34110_c0_g1_i1:49-1770(+)